MTSEQAGAEKPAAQIFLAALQQVGIRPDDSLYVGDHYQSDILGARAVGMKALLIDRYGISDVPSDCLKIDNLKRVIEYLG
jgi:putative hydrolase of the HAD superfamily